MIKDDIKDPLNGILHRSEGVDLIPANLDLSAMKFNLVNAMSRETTLKTYLNEVKQNYDYVLIDCMPSLGMIALNALSAAVNQVWSYIGRLVFNMLILVGAVKIGDRIIREMMGL